MNYWPQHTGCSSMLLVLVNCLHFLLAW